MNLYSMNSFCNAAIASSLARAIIKKVTKTRYATIEFSSRLCLSSLIS